jgi:Na+/H+-dicarboxylate symporter
MGEQRDTSEKRLHVQILLALVLAAITGALVGRDKAVLGVPLVDVFAFVGQLFVRALKMLVVPLVFASIVGSIAAMGGTRGLGRLGLKAGAYYALTTVVAVLAGTLAVRFVRPGIWNGIPARDLIGLSADTAEVTAKVGERGAGEMVNVFLRMIPENVPRAAVEGDMLGLITFALLFGACITRLPERGATLMASFWQATHEVMITMTEWIMALAPVGVFALVAKVVATSGFAAAGPLFRFVLTVAGALAFHALVVMPLVLLVVARVRPSRHFRAVAPALLMAFSTASSAAALPLAMDCVEKRAGVSNRVTSFVLPLGATVNMDGTALYECVAAIFIAQAYGIELTFAQQFTVVAIAVVSSIGVAAIPAASLVAITLILTAIGLPGEAIGLILAVDRILDMGRTLVNVLSDSVGAVVLARSEGEEVPLLRVRAASTDG